MCRGEKRLLACLLACLLSLSDEASAVSSTEKKSRTNSDKGSDADSQLLLDYYSGLLQSSLPGLLAKSPALEIEGKNDEK